MYIGENREIVAALAYSVEHQVPCDNLFGYVCFDEID